MYRREFVFILPTLSLLPKTNYISSVNSLSFSLDIYSVSLHIYVNLIYLHFIVIYGLLCDFINMFCTEVTSRCISVLRSLSALSALSTRTWRVRSSVSRPAPHAGRLFHSLLFAWFWFVSLSDNNYSTSTFYIWVSLLGTLRLIWALVIQRRHSALRRSPSHAGGYSAQTSFIHPLKHVGAASWSRAPPHVLVTPTWSGPARRDLVTPTWSGPAWCDLAQPVRRSARDVYSTWPESTSEGELCVNLEVSNRTESCWSSPIYDF